MECPYCKSKDIRVLDKRDSSGAIRRRRLCKDCNGRFTTYEYIENFNIKVVKRDGKKETYDIDKIRKGLIKAFKKRPSEEEKVERILKDIDNQIKKLGLSKIRSKQIGDIIIDTLEKADKVAYLRFASVYKDFKSLKSFEKELEKIKKGG